MSFSLEEKAILAEKLFYQLVSSPDQYWYNSLFPWVPIVPPNKIWNDIETIPGADIPDDADNAVTFYPTLLEKRKIRLTLDLTSNNRLFLANSTYNDKSTSVYENWIQPSLIRTINNDPSNGYVVRLYHGDPDSGGVELTTTHEGGVGGAPSWSFSYSMGILVISTDKASVFGNYYNTNGLWVEAYRYIGETGGVSDVLTTKTFDCDVPAIIGDVVYKSSTITNKVVVNTDNKVDLVSIGVIIEKPTSTTAKVQLSGNCSVTFSGLNEGNKVYLNSSGELTNTLPVNGYIQIMGMCLEADKVFIDINKQRVKRKNF